MLRVMRVSRTFSIVALFALAGCGEDFGSPDNGCSDDTREGYEGESNIAACQGGFGVVGITSAASQAPACERKAGDDGSNPAGAGCSVEDLCAQGWHVCRSAAEVRTKASTLACPPSSGALFWLTRQAEDANGLCADVGSNNLVGCGVGVGRGAPAGCAPLNTELRYTDCQVLSAWECGTSAEANNEGDFVEKAGPLEGGVLCCRD
jgi:hypothetical protein